MGYLVRPPRTVPPITLQDSTGRPTRLTDADGPGVALVFLGYTNCPDVCPTTLTHWRRVKQALGGDAQRVRFVFVTIDPEHDSPTTVRQFVRQFDPNIVGLVGTKAATDSVRDAFAIPSFDNGPMTADAHAGGLVHQIGLYFVDPVGRLRVVLRADEETEAVVNDLRALLAEKAAG